MLFLKHQPGKAADVFCSVDDGVVVRLALDATLVGVYTVVDSVVLLRADDRAADTNMITFTSTQITKIVRFVIFSTVRWYP
jgi:hypothetical protein